MQIIKLVQGSLAWHEHRAKHFNASDAPAMLGLSKYKTRSQLMYEMHTGMVPEVDVGTQQRFNDGHRFEALARPLAEEIIGEELSPVVGSEGKLSASFDGITFGNGVIFEHKTLNDKIRDALASNVIPSEHCAQMEQQLMISGATKCLFMASKFDGNDVLIEELHCWYESDQVMRDNIMQGWTQFARDLEIYVPPEVVAPAVAAPIRQLPALFAKVEGKFNIATNIAVFSSELKDFVGKMDLSPTDDQGFSDLEAQVRICINAEVNIKAQVLGARGQMVSFDYFCKTADLLLEIAGRARIAGTKAIKEKKVAIKSKAIADARDLFADHVAALETEIYPIRLEATQPNFSEATKGLKGLESLNNEINTALANGKIAADAVAKDIRAKLHWFAARAAEFEFLFRDMQALIQKPTEDFQLAVMSRIDQHQAAESKKVAEQTARIREEQAAAQKTIDAAAYRQLPTRAQLIQAVSEKFAITTQSAEEVLRAEFSRP